MLSSTCAPIYFNVEELHNDLVGKLHACVLFAQSAIIPSRASALAKDVQPHLVASRKTLILLKPLDKNFEADHGISVRVSQRDGKHPFFLELQPPQLLPHLAEQIQHVNEYFFMEPLTYSYHIDSQWQMDSMKGDKSGKFLDNILITHPTVKIETAHGQFIRDFYLSGKTTQHNGCLITFTSDAFDDSNVHYNGKCYVLKQGHKQVFKNIKGTWITINDVSVNDAIHKFAEPDVYSKVIDSQKEFDVMKDDVTGEHFTSLLVDNHNIKVNTGDGRWIPKFFSP